MNVMDTLIVVGFFIAFGCVRFGVPMVICWLMGCAERRFMHPES